MSRRAARGELERRAGEHLIRLEGELGAIGLELRCLAGPIGRRPLHPLASVALAGLLEVATAAVRGWSAARRSRRGADGRRCRPARPQVSEIGRMMTSALVSALGLTMSDWILAELSRRSGERSAAQASPGGQSRETR